MKHIDPRTSRAMREIGGHLSDWRKMLSLTGEQVSERAGISRNTLSRLERGDINVSTATLLSVVAALGLLDRVVAATDPLETDFGRAQAGRSLPQRVRHTKAQTGG